MDKFEALETWDESNKAWNGLVPATIAEDYLTQLASMNATFSAASMRYVEMSRLVYKAIFVAAFLRYKRTVTTLRRLVGRVPMLLSRNGLQCQQVSCMIS